MSSSGNGCGGCAMVFVVILIVNLTLGGVCSDFSLNYYFGVDVPWWGDGIIGLFGGEVLVPATVIGLVLDYGGGIHGPLFPIKGNAHEKITSYIFIGFFRFRKNNIA